MLSPTLLAGLSHKNARRINAPKKMQEKKTRSFCLAAGFWQHPSPAKPICHQVTLATRTSMEANATKNPQKDVTLDAHSAKKRLNSILPYIHIYHIHIYILCFLLRWFFNDRPGTLRLEFASPRDWFRLQDIEPCCHGQTHDLRRHFE